MQLFRSNLIGLIVSIAAITGMLATPSVSAVTRCGTFEMVPIPGMASHLVAFDDGTVWAIGGSTANPSTPVLRHFDGSTWSEQGLPAEADGFAFGSAGSTPDGDAWFEVRPRFM